MNKTFAAAMIAGIVASSVSMANDSHTKKVVKTTKTEEHKANKDECKGKHECKGKEEHKTETKTETKEEVKHN